MSYSTRLEQLLRVTRSRLIRRAGLLVALTAIAGAAAVGLRSHGVATGAAAVPARPVLRVCADPNNLPFSNAKEEGFENRIARLLAEEMGRDVRYTWLAQRRGFIRNTLNARSCDVIVGIPTTVDMLLTTRPYYRSTYVFVTKRGNPTVKSFDDPRLRTMRIGVHLVGDDGANSPPVHALTQRGVVGNLVGFTVYGDYSQPNPPARLMDAVAKDDVDIAVVWGPLAGWAAKRSGVPLELVPVSPQIDLPFLPHVYDISMGVRRADVALRDTLEAIIGRRRADIDAVLDEYGVPRVGPGGAARSSTRSR